MKSRSSTHAKTRYFRKDYAPARLAKIHKKTGKTLSHATNELKKTSSKTSAQISSSAVKDLHRAQKTSSKISKKIKQTAHKTKQVAQKAATSVKKTAQKVAKSTNKAIANSQRSRRKNPAMHSTKRKREPITWREITLVSQIGVSTVAILFTFIFCAFNDPVKRSAAELEKLADAYYIEYLYPSSLGSKLYEPETILKDYTQIGLPAVKLRQLLLYNNGKYANSIEAFDNPYYQCDTNQTYVRYYPVEPYGPRDYTVKYGTACEKVSAL